MATIITYRRDDGDLYEAIEGSSLDKMLRADKRFSRVFNDDAEEASAEAGAEVGMETSEESTGSAAEQAADHDAEVESAGRKKATRKN